jgi:hypothetical protein
MRRNFAFTLLTVTILFAASTQALAGTVHMRPYFASGKSEVILIWDESSGKSQGWYYSRSAKKFKPSAAKYQLPANTGVKGNVMMAPYLGPDGSEVILVWNKKTGESVSWYFSNSKKKFVRSKAQYQLPKQPGKDVMMAPYLTKGGSEVILVWDAATGKSASWYYSKKDKKLKKSGAGFQLPADLGLKGRIMMRPYLAKDGTEVIYTWSVTNGESINWYYSNSKKKFVRSGKGYQLPTNPGVTKDVWLHPYTAGGSEVILVWSAVSGKSVSWYYSKSKKAMTQSQAGFQLPVNPLKAKRTMMAPYMDTGASEVILIWNAKSGVSKSYYYSKSKKKMVVAKEGFQLPAKALEPVQGG